MNGHFPAPWAFGIHNVWLQIVPHTVTGRRLGRSGPHRTSEVDHALVGGALSRDPEKGGLSRSGSDVMDDFYTTFLGTLPVTSGVIRPSHAREDRAAQYSARLLELQIELVKMQQWARASGERVLLLFEGRDTAGKGGTIQRMREHMNPRFARHVALPVPNDTESGHGISSVMSNSSQRAAR